MQLAHNAITLRTLLLFFLFPLFVVGPVGCTSTINNVPKEHILLFNKWGNLLDPTGNIYCSKGSELCNGKYTNRRSYREMSCEEQGKYVRELFENLEKEAPVKDKKRQILIYVHGGLNNVRESIERSTELEKQITREGQYYPLFIIWDSSLVSCYLDHLFSVRQGLGTKTLDGIVTSPLYLAMDAGRGVLRTPLDLANATGNGISNVRFLFRDKPFKTREELLKTEYIDSWNNGSTTVHPGAIAIETGDDDRRHSEKFKLDFYSLLAPVQLVTMPLLDGFGTSSWYVMKRRIHLMFHKQEDFTLLQHTHDPGELSEVMKKFEKDPDSWEFTLVGHSMGTIVLNELIKNFPKQNYNKIVYMAAACSVSDFKDSVLVYLVQHPDSKFYNLTLNRVAEVNEWDFPWGFLFRRGSLLIWIDSFLDRELTPMDRTVGTYENFVRSEHIFPKRVLGQINLKEFSDGKIHKEKEPQKHGDFDNVGSDVEYRFWHQDFYEPHLHL